MKNPNASGKDMRRIELLNAASELLATNPTASLSEIADYASIGKATLHRYFTGREELMLALGYRALEQIAQAIATSEPERGHAIDALTRIIEALVPLGDKLHFLVNESVLDTHPDFAVANHLSDEPIRLLIQRGQANGELRADISAEWMVHYMNYALFATWQSVHAGFVARRDAPYLLATTFLGGIAIK